jgi:hypothetical protein
VALPSSVVPDGLFLSSRNQWVVFELESSDRKASRFQQKALTYFEWLAAKRIDRVLWVACEPTIHRSLVRAAGNHPQFTIGTYSDFEKQLFPRGEA